MIRNRSSGPGGRSRYRAAITVAAGVETLRLADAGVYAAVDAASARVASALTAALAAEGVAHTLSFAGNLFSVAFREAPVRDYDDAKDQEAWRYGPFFHAMLAHGVSLPPSVFEAWFLTAAHDDDAVTRIEEALPHAARAAAAA